MDEQWKTSFKEKLDKAYAWPGLYIFKFIVKAEKEDDVKRLFPLHTNTSRASKNGNYVSLTFQMMMPSPDAVIEVYQRAATVEGIIAL